MMVAFLSKAIVLIPLLVHSGSAFAPSPIKNVHSNFQLQSTAISTEKDYQSLLSQKSLVINALSKISTENVSDVTKLRFALAFDTLTEAKAALREYMTYRSTGRGKVIIDAAQDAYETAAIGGGWDNEVVRNAAPHADIINKYITSKNIITTSTRDGDIVYVIRASGIEEKALMDEVSVEQLSEFFMYVKEIHSIVANTRTEQSGQLCEVIFCNDIVGVRRPPEPRFSKALSSSSAQYAKLYPSLAGPTLILNLPGILQAFVGLFKPLFPKSVQAKLKFLKAPVLASCEDLTPLTDASGSIKQKFIDEVDELLLK